MHAMLLMRTLLIVALTEGMSGEVTLADVLQGGTTDALLTHGLVAYCTYPLCCLKFRSHRYVRTATFTILTFTIMLVSRSEDELRFLASMVIAIVVVWFQGRDSST